MWNTVNVKCSSCHHEDEMMEEGVGTVCSWCKRGIMEELSRNPGIDHHKLIDELRKIH